MEDNTLVKSSFSGTINAPIEKVNIPAWCFTLPEAEYQSCSPAQSGLRIRTFLSAKECRRRFRSGRQIRKTDSGSVMIGNVFARIKSTSHRSCALVAILLALSSICAWSQTQLAAVFGVVSDGSGAVIPAAQVTIVNNATGLKRGTITDRAGQYHLSGLPTGTTLFAWRNRDSNHRFAKELSSLRLPK